MTLFFFVIALELKRELVLGELRNPRMAALPVAAALGGMAVPAGLFSLLVGGGPGASGWSTVMSTDTAFVIGCLAVLGSRIPGSLRLFLRSLAIFDDVGAILVVAIGYGEALNWVALGTAGLGLAVVAAIARLLAVRLRFGTRPSDLPWGLLVAGSLLTGIGFTMALFIAELAFEPELLNSVKLGVLCASVISAALGFVALTWLTSPGRR